MATRRPLHSYWICCSARSGSSLLCQILAATGVAGNPDEYFFWDNMPCQAKPWGMAARWGSTDFEAYVQRSFREGTTANGWFGVKMAPGLYLDTFLQEVRKLPGHADPDLTARELIDRFFPDLRFVFLTRRDKLRQAISWVKASEHDVWTSEQELKPRGMPRHDFARLDAQLTLLSLVESLWQDLFSAWGVRPLTLVYEDFQQDHRGTAARVLDYLGIEELYDYDAPASRILEVRRMTDPTNEGCTFTLGRSIGRLTLADSAAFSIARCSHSWEAASPSASAIEVGHSTTKR